MKTLLPALLFFTTRVFAQVDEPKVIVHQENVENAYPRLSVDNTKILYQSNKSGKWQLYTSGIHGKDQTNISNDQFNDNFPDWSADNKWIAFVSDRDGNEEIYVMETGGKSVKRITNDPGRDIHPYFSPDGKYLLFNSDRNQNQFDVYRYELASGKITQLTSDPLSETCARYSPDLKTIVLLKNGETQDDVYLLDNEHPGMENLTKTPKVEHGWPMFSSDGAWIYYSSMENGTYSIYRIRKNGADKQQLTKAPMGEDHARVNVSRDGKLLIYNIKKGKTIYIVSAVVH